MKRVDGFVECEDLNKFGRFSFNKFNKEIEVLWISIYVSCTPTLYM